MLIIFLSDFPAWKQLKQPPPANTSEFLPSEFGGTLPPYDMGTWARTLYGLTTAMKMTTLTSYNAMHVKHILQSGERVLTQANEEVRSGLAEPSS